MPPIIEGMHYIAITWTNGGGVFQLIIDGVLQSCVNGIETDGIISGQSRFIIGGNELEIKNVYAKLNNLNVWDQVSLVRSSISPVYTMYL